LSTGATTSSLVAHPCYTTRNTLQRTTEHGDAQVSWIDRALDESDLILGEPPSPAPRRDTIEYEGVIYTIDRAAVAVNDSLSLIVASGGLVPFDDHFEAVIKRYASRLLRQALEAP
jgi:hypothetical protein